MNSYTVDTAAMTILVTDDHGETCDLNANGEPCETLDDLRALVRDLREQGAFDHHLQCWQWRLEGRVNGRVVRAFRCCTDLEAMAALAG